MRRCVLFALLWGVCGSSIKAQIDSTSRQAQHTTVVDVKFSGLASSTKATPFWIQANQFGIIPKNSPTGIIQMVLQQKHQIGKKHTNRSLEYAFEGASSISRSTLFVVPQAYAALNLGNFVVWGGRKKEVIGLGDSTLTSGFYAWSGNALPVTKVQIGTATFTPIGFTRGLVSVHAFFAHGWLANSDSIQGAYLHQKAVYVRIGRPSSRVRLTGGVFHNAQWGGRSKYLPASLAKDGQIPSSLNDYLYVLTAREGNESTSSSLTDFDRINRVGNHLGSIDFGIESNVGKWALMSYYQHPFEDKSGVAFVNFPDGLYGFRLVRPSRNTSGFTLQHILVEYLTTMDQSGPMSSTGKRYDGRDDYFNNYQYLDGWVQNRRVIGTPFMTRREDLLPDLQNAKPDFSYYDKWSIANNRVKVVYLGSEGSFASGIRLRTKLAYSHNYGTFRTPFSQAVNQFSGALWVTWPLNWWGGVELGSVLAIDQGGLYGNNVGGHLSIRKTWKSVKSTD